MVLLQFNPALEEHAVHSGQSGCVLVAVVSDKFLEALNLVDEEGLR